METCGDAKSPMRVLVGRRKWAAPWRFSTHRVGADGSVPGNILPRQPMKPVMQVSLPLCMPQTIFGSSMRDLREHASLSLPLPLFLQLQLHSEEEYTRPRTLQFTTTRATAADQRGERRLERH